MREVEEIHRDHPGALRIITGDPAEPSESHTLYEFGRPNAEGIRSIRRAKDDPYLGKILGIVAAEFEGDVVHGVFLGSRQIRVIDECVRVGESMGIQTMNKPESTWCSRTVLSIELLDE